MSFASPLFLLLFIPLFLWGLWYLKKHRPMTVKFSDVASLKQLEDQRTKWLVRLKPVLRFLLLSLIIITLARPQTVNVDKEVISEGIDIMLALDVSGSMRAEDFKPKHRLEVAKKTITQFIDKRKSDRIGLVVFSEEAFTQCPLTLDYYILTQALRSASFDMAGSGTAIGLAIATSLNRLKDSPSKSKVIILLTDGVNNSGGLDPLTAAGLAKQLGIKIYTIGVGKKGRKAVPITDPNTGEKIYHIPELDEVTLSQIAQETGAKYFKATNESTLKEIYSTINSLEKTEIKTKIYREYNDHFITFLWLILGLLLFEQFFISFILGLAP